MPTQNMGGGNAEFDYTEIKHISDKVGAIDLAIRGNGYNQDGLIAEFRQFKTDIMQLRTDLTRYMEERKTWERNLENRVARVENDLQDLLRWRSQQPQARTTSWTSYIQMIVLIAGIVLTQLLIAWASANYFYK